MDSGVDSRSIENAVNNIALQLMIWMAICAGAYIIAFIILRFINVSDKIAHFIATLVFLVAMYYSFVNGFIPGVEEAH